MCRDDAVDVTSSAACEGKVSDGMRHKEAQLMEKVREERK